MNKSQLDLQRNKPRVFDKVIKNGMRIVRIEPSYICNMRCRHCCIRELQIYNMKRSMTIDDIKSIADQADALGFGQFVISGGEPMMYPDFFQMVEAIDPKRFYITTDSNGWYLDEVRARLLKMAGVDKVQMSIDSLYPEVHDDFRQKEGAWKKAVDAIKFCQDAGLRVIVQTVVTKDRVYTQELKDFIKFFNLMDVPVVIMFGKPVGAWKGREDILVGDKELAYIDGLTKTMQAFSHLTPSYDYPGGCIAMKRMINITKYGDVNPCPVMQELSIGNVFKEPLADIVERGNKAFADHIPTCLMATEIDFVKRYKEEHAS